MEFQDTSLLDYYVYNFDFPALAPATVDTQRAEIEADANFIWMKTSGFADIAAAIQTAETRVVPLVTLQVFDTGSGRQLFNGETPWSNVVGWGEIPYILPIKRKYKANSVIRVTATNFSAATTYNLKLSFSGIKDFGVVQQRVA